MFARLHMNCYRHVFIDTRALAVIRAELKQSRFRETGGVLCGYPTVDMALVITHASGPGTGARRRLFSVSIRGKSAKDFCEQVENETGDLSRFVGDWHSHMGKALDPSPQDIESLTKLRDLPEPPCPGPVALICSRWTQNYAVYALVGDTVKRLDLSVL